MNAVPYLCGVHKPCPLLQEETVPNVVLRLVPRLHVLCMVC